MDDIVVDDQQEIRGITQGNLIVRDGGIAILLGTHQGSTRVESGGRLDVRQTLQGSTDFLSGAEVIVSGDLQGSSSVHDGAIVTIEPGGCFAGSITNYGRIINRGLLAGPIAGNAAVDEGGRVLQPQVGPDGSNTYEIPPRGRR